MADVNHLEKLKQGISVWNDWRKQFPRMQPDLKDADLKDANLDDADFRRADLSGANLSNADLNSANFSYACLSNTNLSYANLIEADLYEADLRGTNLSHTNLSDAYLAGTDLRSTYLNSAYLNGANLFGANLSGVILTYYTHLNRANLSRANLYEANLNGADLSYADLYEANLSGANLSGANLSGANLNGANLNRTNLVGTNLIKSTLKDCSIYGISAWDVQLEGAEQLNLTITPAGQPTITVDNLKVAQFIYLLLNNQEIRDVINTITTKVVLILGRFTPERKRVLDALRDELRKKDYLPIVFDFQKPTNRDLTETVSTLAHMARFIIADITDPKSIPQELRTIILNLPSVVVQPILHARSKEYGMFGHFKSFPWVLETHRYTTVDRLLVSLKEHIIEPAEQKAQELKKR
jgi:uncharacterized protein YjbI with pentapeptide repeats